MILNGRKQAVLGSTVLDVSNVYLQMSPSVGMQNCTWGFLTGCEQTSEFSGLFFRFLAPETLSSNWSPKSDVWAAGVMAHELLTGRLPFNDKRNLYNPALSAVLRSILTDKLDFTKPCWSEISPEGIDFVKCVPFSSMLYIQ